MLLDSRVRRRLGAGAAGGAIAVWSPIMIVICDTGTRCDPAPGHNGAQQQRGPHWPALISNPRYGSAIIGPRRHRATPGTASNTWETVRPGPSRTRALTGLRPDRVTWSPDCSSCGPGESRAGLVSRSAVAGRADCGAAVHQTARRCTGDWTLLVTGWPSTGCWLNLTFLSLHLVQKVKSLLASNDFHELLPMWILFHFTQKENMLACAHVPETGLHWPFCE